jgi:hypothetical protein
MEAKGPGIITLGITDELILEVPKKEAKLDASSA